MTCIIQDGSDLHKHNLYNQNKPKLALTLLSSLPAICISLRSEFSKIFRRRASLRAAIASTDILVT